MLRVILGIVLFCLAFATSAQTNCPAPTLKLYHNDKELNGTASEDLSSLTIAIAPDAKCPTDTTFEIVRGMAYLIRGEQVLTQQVISGANVMLGHWMPRMKAGDKVSVVIDRMYLITGRVQKKPYSQRIFTRLTIK